MSYDPDALIARANDQSGVTAAALMDRARQDFAALVADLPAPAAWKDRFACDGAQGALMFAYILLAAASLAHLPPAELDEVIYTRVGLLESGLRIFVEERRGK